MDAASATAAAEQELHGLEIPVGAAPVTRYIPRAKNIPEISRNMLRKGYQPRRDGIIPRDKDGKPLPGFEVQTQVTTLPVQSYEQQSDQKMGRQLNKPVRGTQQVNFQDLNDENASALIGYALLDQDGNLFPEFSDFETVSDVVTAYAITLTDALEIAYKSGQPFEGTKTYVVKEAKVDADGNYVEEEDEEGNVIQVSEDRAYLLFARETPMIDRTTGKPLEKEERAELRDPSIRYNGPKALPVLPLGEVQDEHGNVRTLALAITYAEQRNLDRAWYRANQSSVSYNSWLFGMGLLQFNGTITQFYQEFPTKFPDRKDMLGAVVTHAVSTSYDTKATEATTNHLLALREQAAAAGKPVHRSDSPIRRRIGTAFGLPTTK